jgi:NADP-dependent 3-hydroxy acid dehydrogenase YdfG
MSEPDRGFDAVRVLITGAASGVGRACALLDAGAYVVGLDMRPSPYEHARFVALAGDVTRPADIDRVYACCGPRGVDAVVSAAGVGVHERLADGDPAGWARVIDINLVGALRIIRALVPGMIQRGRGDVVMISSVAARKAYAFGGVYAASKAALERAAEALRLELLPTVRVATVAPGMIDTGFFEHAPGYLPTPDEVGEGALTADDVAEIVCFVLSRPPSVAIAHVAVRPAAQRL